MRSKPFTFGGAMDTNICLMQGVNVGGNNMFDMKALKSILSLKDSSTFKHTFSRTRWTQVVGTKCYKSFAIRIANIERKPLVISKKA